MLEQATDLINLTDVKRYLKIDFTDTTNDDLLLGWITQSTSQIENFIDQPVMSREAVDICNGTGGWTLTVKTGRIISLVSLGGAGTLLDPLAINNVQYRTLSTDLWQPIATDPNQLYVDPSAPWTLVLNDFYLFYYGINNVRVRYNAGFATVPGDFTEVCVQMVATMWNESKRSVNPRLGMRTANRGGAGQSVGDSYLDMDASWARMLQKYRKLI